MSTNLKGKPLKPLKPNALALLNQKAKPITNMKDHAPGEEKVPDELKQIATEAKEIALLKHQLTNNPQNVNEFLTRKYTDGNSFAVARKDTYDNSEERKRAGISFTYHVFYPINPGGTDPFPNNKYMITDRLVDTESGDEYYYHFPIRKGHVSGIPYYKTDYFNELVTPDGKPAPVEAYPNTPGYDTRNRLFYALQTLARHLKIGNSTLPRDAYKILEENEFMDETGKLNLAVKVGVMVEKYFHKFQSPERRIYGIQYLEKEMKTLPQALEMPEGLVPPSAVGEAAETAAPATATTTTTTTTTKSKDDDDTLKEFQIPPQEAGKVTVRSSKPLGTLFNDKSINKPLPTAKDSVEEVIKKLEARGVTVRAYRGTPKTRATSIEKDEKPLPLCFGTHGVVLLYVRPFMVGLNYLQYRNTVTLLYSEWIDSINKQNMTSIIPTGRIAELIRHNFGSELLDDPLSMTDVVPKEGSGYK